MKSFLLIGQSNMAGRGEFGEVPEIINSKCFMLRNGKWVPMSEPINPDRSIFNYFHSGRGLSASFADEYAKYFNEDVGLIPCADGGTKLSQWMPGEILYDNAVNNAKLAQRTSEIVGILWHQGENDSHFEEDANTYQQRFTEMITRLRKDLGNEKLPVIVGELGRFAASYQNGKLKYMDIVNEALRTMPFVIENCGFASSEDLTDRGDSIHFNSVSYRIFGKRYFNEYLNVVGAENEK